MIETVLALGLVLIGSEWSRGDSPPSSAADRITLRDGSVVLGVVNATTPGPRGSVEFLVRRDWAEKALKSRAKLGPFDRSERPTGSGAAAEKAAGVAARSSIACGGERSHRAVDRS